MMNANAPLGSVVAVNARLLAAVLMAYASYWCWPSSAQWWQFGLFSIFLGLMAFAQGVAALRLIAKLRIRERAIRTMQQSGAAPKSATLANDDILRDAGVIDE